MIEDLEISSSWGSASLSRPSSSRSHKTSQSVDLTDPETCFGLQIACSTLVLVGQGRCTVCVAQGGAMLLTASVALIFALAAVIVGDVSISFWYSTILLNGLSGSIAFATLLRPALAFHNLSTSRLAKVVDACELQVVREHNRCWVRTTEASMCACCDSLSMLSSELKCQPPPSMMGVPVTQELVLKLIGTLGAGFATSGSRSAHLWQ